MEVMESGEAQAGGREEESVELAPPPGFPYCFDGKGCLRHRDTGDPFRFCFRRGEGTQHGEEEQEALGRCITRHVFGLLEEQWRLSRVALPGPGQARVWVSPGLLEGGRMLPRPGRVWVSPGALEGGGTLLVLLQDRGSVRSGQWSWQAIARGGLEAGSQIPYVRRALQERWGVALLDPNTAGASPEEHLRQAWDGLLDGAGVGPVAMVTHGYGGLAFVDLLSRRPQEVMQRVCAVAFVDSAHNLWHQPLGAASRDWLKAHSRKWVLSGKPVNRPVSSLKAGCAQLSAGTLSHEHAPAACLDAVFRYITKTLRAKPPPTPFHIITRSQGRSRPPRGGAKHTHTTASKT